MDEKQKKILELFDIMSKNPPLLNHDVFLDEGFSTMGDIAKLDTEHNKRVFVDDVIERMPTAKEFITNSINSEWRW